ncbi:MAG: hypothetical protein RMJ89_13450, partial [Flammeovirgaceae bacterium]|nr:hypothetical protein [Flammeovirgaceae bacterium]
MMKKRFNITGKCDPRQHYMMDNTAKVQKVLELVEAGMYFAINRPRQYGKTTTLSAVAEKLRQTDTYFPIELNFQGIDNHWHESDSSFAKMFIKHCGYYIRFADADLYRFFQENATEVID